MSMSLPFMYGFPNKRWTKTNKMIDKKKRGVHKIKQLRIIGIVEADYSNG